MGAVLGQEQRGSVTRREARLAVESAAPLYGMGNGVVVGARIAALVVLVVSATAVQAQDTLVDLVPVEVSQSLDGAAFHLSVGPAVEATVESDLGEVIGHRTMRVTLFQVEQSYWIRVESIFTNRAGGKHVEWCSDLHSDSIPSLCRGSVRISAEGFRWVEPDAFEFVDHEPAIDVASQKPVSESRCLRFKVISEQVVSVVCREAE